MRIGILGAGQVGTTLGTSWHRAGHEIVYGVRDVARAKVERAVPTSELAAAVDALVLTTSWDAAPAAVVELGDCRGLPLLDVTNPIGRGFTLAVGHTTSGAEQLAATARNAHVVKAFNTTGLENMANPRYGTHRLVMPIAGDDPGALAIATRLATELGFEPVALTGLAHARQLEPFAMLWIKLALQLGHGRDFGFGLVRRGGDPGALAASSAPQAITVVGTGSIGAALAAGWVRAGHAVTVAARDVGAPDSIELARLGARVVPIEGAAEGSAIIALAVPAAAAAEVVRQLGPVAGKIIVDCTNAIARGFQLQHGHSTSSVEELAKTAPDARFVRAFNQQGAEVLRDPRFGERSAVNFVAGDDAAARASVLALTRDLGLEGVDVGPLASSRLIEPITLLWIAMAKVLGTRELGLAMHRRS